MSIQKMQKCCIRLEKVQMLLEMSIQKSLKTSFESLEMKSLLAVEARAAC